MGFKGVQRPLVLSVCTLALALGAFASYTKVSGVWSAADGNAQNNPVGRSDKVAALGRIEPHSEIINFGAGVMADRVETLFVARGDRVAKDQVLGYLAGYAEQVSQREMFQAQLREARSRLETEIALNRARIEAAEIRQKQILEVSPLKIVAQEATIANLEATLANNNDIMTSQRELLSRGAASRRLHDNQKTIVLQNEADLAAARARLAELKRQFELDQIDAEVQIRLARAALRRAEVEFPVMSLERQIALADARARRLTLVAPVDSQILNIRIKPGEQIGSGPILTIGDTARMRAVAEVYETDITRVQVGQSAQITSRALPQPIRGTIVRIGNMIFKNDILNVDPAARADARVVEVWIDLEDSVAVERLTNLTVDVLIDVSAPDAAALATPVAR